jgi:membrane-associated phospholipid phosphatase
VWESRSIVGNGGWRLAVGGWRLAVGGWRLAVGGSLVCPLVTIEIGEAFKRLFDRRNGDYLEYPSGHTALVVAVLGMVVLVAGGRLWAVIVAVVVSTLGIL